MEKYGSGGGEVWEVSRGLGGLRGFGGSIGFAVLQLLRFPVLFP